jgi:uncharacterized protein
MAALPRFHTARGAEPLSRGSALLQVALAMLLLTAWMLAVRQSGLAAWIARSVGAWSLVAAVVLQGAPALLLVAALLRWHGEPWSAIGLGPAPPASVLGRGLLTAASCYAVQPLLVSAYLAATGQSERDLASQKLAWLSMFATLPAAALFPVALFVGVYEEIVFRGFLQSRLELAVGATATTGRARAAAVVVLSALLFGVGHGYQGAIGIVQTTAIGLVLGASTYWSRSLWPAVVAHVAIDTIGLTAAKYLTPHLSEMLGGP